MRADLHAHTTASDGALTPPELVSLALDVRLDVLGVTDHDSVEGIPHALDAAEGSSLTVIPGVELSAVWEGRDVHILGYFVDYSDATLRAHLDDLRAARMRRAQSTVDALMAAGYDLDITDVLQLSNGGAVGRSHVARALVNRGHSRTVADAFHEFLGRGAPFYVPKDVRAPDDVVRMIVQARGIPVFAHPGVTQADAAIPGMVEAGLRGLEAYHAEHTEPQRVHYAKLAADLGLLVTGGTDYHGPHAPNPELGTAPVPEQAVRSLLEAGGLNA